MRIVTFLIILQMRKQRHREAKFFAQAHTASKSQSWDSGWGGLSPCAVSHFALLKYGLILNQRSLDVEFRNLDFIFYIMDESWEALNIFKTCDVKGNVKNHIFTLVQLFKLYFCLFLPVYT